MGAITKSFRGKGLHRKKRPADTKDCQWTKKPQEERDNESDRNRAADRRPGAGSHPQRDPPDHAYQRGRPVTDNVETVGEVLLWDDRVGEKDRGDYIEGLNLVSSS